MPALMNHTVLPSDSDDREALTSLKDALIAQGDISLMTSEGAMPLPERVRGLLVDAVAALSRGEAVTVEPHRTVLTTQEAAGMLGITRPTFVRLLEAGKIPYTCPGRHRRVELADVLEFQQREGDRRRQVLEEMARESTTDPDGASDGFAQTR